MAIRPGDTIDPRPTVDDLASGLPLQLPKRLCTILGMDSGSFKKFPALGSDKAAILTYLTNVNLVNVPQPFRTTDFAIKGYPIVGKINRLYCPWFDNNAVRYTVDVIYEEGVSPSNSVTAPSNHYDLNWGANTSPAVGVVSGTPPGNFAYLGGGVPWDADVKIEAIDDADHCDKNVRVTATLTSTNYDFLSGTPVVQVQDQVCEPYFHAGIGLFFFWTGVHFNPGDPVGLVRSMGITVRGSTIYS